MINSSKIVQTHPQIEKHASLERVRRQIATRSAPGCRGSIHHCSFRRLLARKCRPKGRYVEGRFKNVLLEANPDLPRPPQNKLPTLGSRRIRIVKYASRKEMYYKACIKLPCCCAVMLLCCYAVMLLCCYAVMLLCCYAVMLLCCYAVMLLCCYVVMLLCCYAVMLLCCYVVMLLCCYAVML